MTGGATGWVRGGSVATDSSSAFAAECCLLDEDARTTLPELYKVYATWCKDSGLQPFSARKFNRRLRERFRGQADVRPIAGVDTWVGLEISPNAPRADEWP